MFEAEPSCGQLVWSLGAYFPSGPRFRRGILIALTLIIVQHTDNTELTAVVTTSVCVAIY
jgi:hypothetical protein